MKSTTIEKGILNFLSFTKKFFEAVSNKLSSKTDRYDKIFSILIVVLMIPTIISQVIIHNSTDYMNYKNRADFAPDWGITEWLISYDGGFVRRGLTGEIIKFIAIFFNLPPVTIIVCLSILIFTILVVWTIISTRKNFPVYLLLSPLLLGAPIFSGYIIRKDVLIALLVVTGIKILVSHSSKYIKYILINIISIVSLLVHEIYIFVGFPLLFIINFIQTKNKFFSIDTILFLFFPLIVTIIIFLNKGNEEIILTIIKEWNELHHIVASSYCCFGNPEAAFLAIYSDISWHMEINLYNWTLYIYGFLWNPGIWFLIWLMCGLFISKFFEFYCSEKVKTFVSLYLMQSICAIPLFVIAWDYGRWIFFISFFSFFAAHSLKENSKIPYFNNNLQIPIWKGPLLLWQKILIIFAFGIPHRWGSLEYQIHAIPIFDFFINLF